MIKRILKSWKFWLVLMVVVMFIFLYSSGNYLDLRSRDGTGEAKNQNPIDYVTNRIRGLAAYVQDRIGGGITNNDPEISNSLEAVIGQDCLTVFPTNIESSEEIDSWIDQYSDALLKGVTGEDNPPESYEVFLLPTSSQPECAAILYEDPSSKEKFLIYETEDQPVKVPFTSPSNQ